MTDETEERERLKAAWDTLLSLRNEDLRLVWTRSSVLIALHGGLFAVHAAVSRREEAVAVVALDVAGLVLALVWVRIAHAGVYYQRYWQKQMENLESK